MKKTKKITAIVLSLAMVAGISVAATLAILSESRQEALTNTFTVQSGKLFTRDDLATCMIIKESAVKQDAKGDWVEDSKGTSTETGHTYNNLTAGTSIFKDPKLTVTNVTNDMEMYIYVKVVPSTNMSSIMEASEYDVDVYNETSNSTGNWHKLLDVANTYVYKDKVTSVGIADIGIFKDTTLQLKGSFDSNVSDLSIAFNVYAAQCIGDYSVENAKTAWTVAKFA